MPLSQLLNRACTITRRSESEDETNAYGDPVIDETTVETVCELQQTSRAERALAGETSDTTWDLYLPAGTAIGTGDAIEVDGVSYELVGDPWKARNPRTQAESHVEATVRRVAGSEDA